jgi:copper(I)-binding protein
MTMMSDPTFRALRLVCLAIALLCLAGTPAALGQDGPGIEMHHAWARASAGAAGTVYGRIVNRRDTADRLRAVAVAGTAHVMLHETVVEEGIARMRPLEAVEVAAHSEVALAPGGKHIMVMGNSKPLEAGDTIVLTLTFESAGEVTVEVPVMPLGAMGPETHAHHQPAGNHAHQGPSDTHAHHHESAPNQAMAAAAGHGGHGGAMAAGSAEGCRFGLELSEAAERKPGGALYRGEALTLDSRTVEQLPEMSGAHQHHRPGFGGVFYMAPNKLNHVEMVYREGCGLSVVFYNAYTEPIAAKPFVAFARVIPDHNHLPELTRFLLPDEHGEVLASAAPLHAEVPDFAPPFSVELYVKFPRREEPELFTFHIER